MACLDHIITSWNKLLGIYKHIYTDLHHFFANNKHLDTDNQLQTHEHLPNTELHLYYNLDCIYLGNQLCSIQIQDHSCKYVEWGQWSSKSKES